MKNNRRLIATALAIGIALMMLIPAGIVAGGAAAPSMVEQPITSEATASGGGDSEINTIVIQPNATEGKDTYIYSNLYNQKSNFGAQDSLFLANMAATSEH